MHKGKLSADETNGSRQSLKTIVRFNQQTQDQMPDLGKAINVFKPANEKNPFLEQSKQGPPLKSQDPACESVDQKK